MFSDDKNIDNIESLFKEIKNYVLLQRDYFKLDLVEKLSILVSALVVAVLLMAFVTIGLFYLSFSVVYALEPLIGSLTGSYAVVGGLFFLLAVIVYVLRKPLIIVPLINFLGKLFLQDEQS